MYLLLFLNRDYLSLQDFISALDVSRSTALADIKELTQSLAEADIEVKYNRRRGYYMMGAAVATVLGQILTAALSVWYLCRSQTVHLDRSCFHVDWKLDRQFLPLGMTTPYVNYARRAGAVDAMG